MRVAGIRELCQGIKEYILEGARPLNSRPGQYLMVWIPRVGEIPISVAWEEDCRVRLVVARRGRVTGYMHDNIRAGDRMFVRGPFGRGFSLDSRRPLIVAGGYGNAPLYHLARTLKSRGAVTTVVLGFKNRDNALLVEDFKAVTDRLIVATEDGTLGIKGTAVDVAVRLLDGDSYDFVYTCGKELMMKEIVEAAMDRGLRVEASLERYIKCGIGLCGTCVLEPLGLRVCRDGPVFNGEILVKLDDFGRWWHDAAGRRVPLPQ